ncbi:MAG: DUF4198 domain-containing protein [Phycisphaerales bacterium]|nr:DUF4198 domain-containing protein [Hyphomonadaceae bacterium]
MWFWRFRSLRTACLSVSLALAFAGSAEAHDFWLQPEHFHVEPSANIDTLMYVGHGADRQTWGVAASRITTLRTIGAAGAVDARTALGGRDVAGQATFRFAEPGFYIFALESSEAVSTLPSAPFQAYARDEGLTAVLRHRQQARTTRREGREIYSRRAKAIVQVGSADETTSAHITRPLGLTLEIVPERNPSALTGAQRLPVLVYYRGTPLPGARVTLTNLLDDAHALAAPRTDRNGRAVFAIPGAGAYLLNVVWSRPLEGDPRAEYETIFSSLTFATR